MLTRWFNYLWGANKTVAPAKVANTSPSLTSDEKKAATDKVAGAPDPLGAFQMQLKNKESEFYQELEIWKKHREYEFSTASLALKHLAEHDPVLHKKVKGIFSRIWGAIKKALEPANMELDDLMDEAGVHLTELKDHLNELCKALKERSDSPMNDEIKKIRIDICDTSIIMLNEMIVLINDIAKEIEYCLKSESTAEIVADELFDTIVRIILGLPMPNFNVDLNNPYRHFLYDEVSEEKGRLELEETELEGDLQKAEKLLEEPLAIASNPNALFKAVDPAKPKSDNSDLLVDNALAEVVVLK